MHSIYNRCIMYTMKRRCFYMCIYETCVTAYVPRDVDALYVFMKLAIGRIMYITDASCIPWNVDALCIDDPWRHYVYHSLT